MVHEVHGSLHRKTGRRNGWWRASRPRPVAWEIRCRSVCWRWRTSRRPAYRALLEKTAHLPADRRHRFLHDIPEHEILVQAAARAGIR